MQNLNIKRTLLLFFIVLSGNQMFAQESMIIPYPAEVTAGSGHFSLTAKTRITFSAGLTNEANYLHQILKGEQQLVLPSAKQQSGKANPGAIQLELIPGSDASQHPEQYTLAITSGNIKITGNSAAGVFYGIQSLRQLIKMARCRA